MLMKVASKKEITLAPPLLPSLYWKFSAEFYYASCPNEVPDRGLAINSFSRLSKSLEREWYFIKSGFAAEVKDLVIITVTFTQEVF